jgi:hemerythrin
MIEWNDRYLTGHAKVDEDHKRLFACLNQLDAALKQGAAGGKIDEIITFLSAYTREHFVREEKHMHLVGCPAYDENCRAHSALVSKLDAWLAKKAAGSSTGLALEIFFETSSWIRNHIMKVDCRLRGCRAA